MSLATRHHLQKPPQFCLRKTAELGEEEFRSDAKEFVHNNFYVDKGLKSVIDSAEGIDLLSHTQAC